MALLTPELLRRLEQFQLLAARRAKSSAKGERRSRARGQSVEFADYRNYVAGDDLRYLDWNLFGRLERLFLKLYEEERELPVRIFLDCSESMNFGEPRKFDFARQVAAAIGYVALCGFDRVSVVPFPNEGENVLTAGALRSVRGRKSSLQYFQNIVKLQCGGAANLNEALRRGALEARQAGVAVVLSDFLDPAGYEPGLNALIGRGFQINAVQILAPDELAPANFGDLRLVDAETGAIQEVTFGKYRLSAYQQTVQNFIQKLREFCATRGVNFFSVSSATKLEDLLLKQLRASEVWA
jgi:Mg-chelatase subunit ChlD